MGAYNFVRKLRCDSYKRILRTNLYTMRTNFCALAYKFVRSVVRKVCLYESQRSCAQNCTQTFSVYIQRFSGRIVADAWVTKINPLDVTLTCFGLFCSA